MDSADHALGSVGRCTYGGLPPGVGLGGLYCGQLVGVWISGLVFSVPGGCVRSLGCGREPAAVVARRCGRLIEEVWRGGLWLGGMVRSAIACRLPGAAGLWLRQVSCGRRIGIVAGVGSAVRLNLIVEGVGECYRSFSGGSAPQLHDGNSPAPRSGCCCPPQYPYPVSARPPLMGCPRAWWVDRLHAVSAPATRWADPSTGVRRVHSPPRRVS